jgi:hypothetical protein
VQSAGLALHRFMFGTHGLSYSRLLGLSRLASNDHTTPLCCQRGRRKLRVFGKGGRIRHRLAAHHPIFLLCHRVLLILPTTHKKEKDLGRIEHTLYTSFTLGSKRT